MYRETSSARRCGAQDREIETGRDPTASLDRRVTPRPLSGSRCGATCRGALFDSFRCGEAELPSTVLRGVSGDDEKFCRGGDFDAQAGLRRDPCEGIDVAWLRAGAN